MITLLIKMGALPERITENKKSTSSKKSMIIVIGILAGIALAGVSYMMIFVEPELIEEQVKVIAVTESGCIAETFDGFAVNIGKCNAQPGDVLMAPIDQKVKERAMAMNPS
jgi:flagellar basal body-associated protein FliL